MLKNPAFALKILPLLIVGLSSCTSRQSATVAQGSGLTPPTPIERGAGPDDGWTEVPPPPKKIASPLPDPVPGPITLPAPIFPSSTPVVLPSPHFPSLPSPAPSANPLPLPLPSPVPAVIVKPPLPWPVIKPSTAPIPGPSNVPPFQGPGGQFGLPKKFVPSHDVYAKPHFYTPGVEGIFGDSHGGYGYLDRSEALGDSKFRFGCTKPEMESYLSLSSKKDPAAIALLASQRLREELFEFLTLRYAALDTERRPVKIVVPPGACIHPQSSGFHAIEILPSTLPTDEEIFNSPPDKMGLLIKYRGAAMQLEPMSWAFALVLDDHLAYQEKDVCDPQKLDEASCFDVRAMRSRLLADFEALFHLPADRYEQFLKRVMSFVGASILMDQQLKDSHSNQFHNLDPKKAFELGRSFYLDTFKPSPDSVIALQTGVEHALRNSKSPLVTPLLKSVSADLIDNFAKVIRANRIRIQSEADHLCERDLDYVVKKFPNVVRQTLLDLPVDERAALQYHLCGMPAFQEIQPKISCKGVDDDKKNKTVNVNRRSPSYPYASTNHYSISETPAGETLVGLVANFTFDDDFSKSEREGVLARWQESANSWYNCQVGAHTSSSITATDGNKTVTLNCPPEKGLVYSPKARFNIELRIVAPGTKVSPLVQVHKCYRSETGSSSCAQVRKDAVNICQDQCAKGATSCVNACEQNTPAVGDPFNNRQDSGNFVVQQAVSVLYHELGHLMGLNDEYTDLSLPLNLIGESASIMRNSHSVYSRLYPRQLQQMLEPLRCVK